MTEFTRPIFTFIGLILLQVLLINNIQVSQYLSPMLIVFFVISQPFDTPKSLSLLLSFVLGLIIDAAMNTPGISAFSLVFVSFIRPFILQMIQDRTSYLPGSSPSVGNQGWKWYIYFSSILTLSFHLLYFSILDFKALNFFFILWKTCLSSIFVLFLIYIVQLFSTRK